MSSFYHPYPLNNHYHSRVFYGYLEFKMNTGPLIARHSQVAAYLLGTLFHISNTPPITLTFCNPDTIVMNRKNEPFLLYTDCHVDYIGTGMLYYICKSLLVNPENVETKKTVGRYGVGLHGCLYLEGQAVALYHGTPEIPKIRYKGMPIQPAVIDYVHEVAELRNGLAG